MLSSFWFRLVVTGILVFGISSIPVFAKYKVRPLQPKAASEYSTHQDFQNIVIGAQVANTKEETLEFFDEKKLYEKDFIPILVVVQNNNPFPIRVDEATIFLVVKDGSQKRTVSYLDVLLAIKLKKPRSNYSSSKEMLAKEVAKEEMFNDFKQKAFGEKLIAPMSSAHGIIFYERPYEEEGDISDFLLYLPEIVNASKGEALMFFELELKGN
jgi:hypothetical protein